MSDLQITNTLSRSKEEFTPLQEGKVTFYHCGPTVYWVQHIGNMLAATKADFIRRTLEYLGYDVTFVRNYTDVGHLTGDNIGQVDQGEDRMEKGARREGKTPQEIADKYIKIFEEDIQSLNIKMPDHQPRATEYIQPIIDMVQTLIDKGYAYVKPRAVYYDVSKFADYNKLNKQKRQKNIVGAGVGEVTDTDKRNPEDFALWVFRTGPHKNALQYWESPFESPEVEKGHGFPGWAIECSVMANELLGKTIDMHMGGVEHISIHHTNEIAQSEAANGQKFVNYWLHNEHLLVDGGKMSKSDGNVYTLQNIKEKGFDPIDLRYFFLQAHYRSQQNFTWKALKSAQSARTKLLAKTKEMLANVPFTEELMKPESLAGFAKGFRGDFKQALSDDFNTAGALATVWDMLKTTIPNSEKLTLLIDFDHVLAIGVKELVAEHLENKVDKNKVARIEELVAQREEFRQQQKWDKSDEARDKLNELGVIVKDTDNGPEWRFE